MGEDLSLHGRDAVRTPMQWSREQNGGFSAAEPDRLVEPVIDQGPYGFREVNVADHERDADSLLNVVRRLAWTRRRLRAIGSHHWEVPDVEHPAVLALSYPGADYSVLTVHNLGSDEAEADLSPALEDASRAVDVAGDCPYELFGEGEPRFTLAGYGYRWLRISVDQPPP